MNYKILAIIPMLLTVTAVFATSSINPNWRIYNVKPDTASYWDINKVKSVDGKYEFPIAKFESPTTGSFAVYILQNYNYDLTGKTFSMSASWTSGTYKTRSTVHPGAYVRFEFQDTSAGPYDMNDYWWSTGTNSLDLNAASSGSLTVSLEDPSKWTNLCGKSATDTTLYSGPDCVGGYPTMNPAEGFANAMKNVKEVSLAFGSSGSYASGVALDGGAGIFTMESFNIQ